MFFWRKRELRLEHQLCTKELFIISNANHCTMGSHLDFWEWHEFNTHSRIHTFRARMHTLMWWEWSNSDRQKTSVPRPDDGAGDDIQIEHPCLFPTHTHTHICIIIYIYIYIWLSPWPTSTVVHHTGVGFTLRVHTHMHAVHEYIDRIRIISIQIHSRYLLLHVSMYLCVISQQWICYATARNRIDIKLLLFHSFHSEYTNV